MTLILSAALMLLLPGGADAQWTSGRPEGQPTERAKILDEIGFDQKLQQQLPLDLSLTDETGAAVPLRSLFGARPVVLAFVYYECPMLCTLTLNGLLKALRVMSYTAGQEFDILTVSFDPAEGPALAAAKKKVYLSQYGRAGAERGWHFLTGDSKTIQTLTAAAGFKYRWDPQSNQFAHAAGISVLTPAGVLSRYFFGVEFSARDLKLAVIEAGAGKIGSLADQVFLYCYRYDPVHGKYAFAIISVIRILGLFTVLALLTFVLVSTRRERAQSCAQPAAPSA